VKTLGSVYKLIKRQKIGNPLNNPDRWLNEEALIECLDGAIDADTYDGMQIRPRDIAKAWNEIDHTTKSKW
jgi:hypothetical protein